MIVQTLTFMPYVSHCVRYSIFVLKVGIIIVRVAFLALIFLPNNWLRCFGDGFHTPFPLPMCARVSMKSPGLLSSMADIKLATGGPV